MLPGDSLKKPGSDELSLESMTSVYYDPHRVMGTKVGRKILRN